MEVIDRAELSVIGVEVVADFADLPTAAPQAWSTLFSRRGELPAPPDGMFVEVSRIQSQSGVVGGGDAAGVGVCPLVGDPQGYQATTDHDQQHQRGRG